MSWYSKVAWSEGLFLRPHHLQQGDRYLEHLLEGRTSQITPYPWGFSEIEIDRDLAQQSKFGLRRAAGILSDGTPVLRFLDPKTLKVVRTLTVTAEGVPIRQVNELEYVRGEILANIWMTNAIARIDPATGHVKGWIDVSALAARVGATDPDAVPNGIAYDKVGNRLFVTGKNWPLLFQIRPPAAR